MKFTSSRDLGKWRFDELKGTNVYATMVLNMVRYDCSNAERDEKNPLIAEWLKENCRHHYFHHSYGAQQIFFLSRRDRDDFLVWANLKWS